MSESPRLDGDADPEAALQRFIERCEAFARQVGRPLTYVSEKLFSDQRRLQQLRDKGSDVGARRLARALRDLSALEAAVGCDGAHKGGTPSA